MAFRLSSIPSYNLSTDYGNQAGQIADIGASVAEGVEAFRKQRREEDKQRREQELRRQVAEATGRGDYSGAAQGLLSAGRFGDAGSFLKLGSENDARKSDQQLLSSLSAPSGGQRLSDMGRDTSSAPASLIRNESGGRYDARNDAVGAGGMKGHFGRLQFGQARLQEAAAAGAIPQGTTPEQFMASPELQHAAERWHFQDIDNFIRSTGLEKAIGKPVAGTVATVDGMRAVAHLGGKEGLAKFVASNGQYNPADSNGTRLSDYFSRHSGGGAAQQQPAPPVQVAQNGVPDSGLLSQDPRIQQLTRALAAARTDEGRKAIQAQLEIVREDAKFAREGNRPTDVQRNYQAAVQQGYKGSLFDYQKELRSGTTIRNQGAPPPGYRAVYDASGNVERLEPIPGGEPAQKAAEAASKKDAQQKQTQRYGSVVLNAIDDIERLQKEASLPTTGGLGALVSRIGGTSAGDIRQSLSTIKANISFERLNEMRQSSPTGGALGAITEGELKLLQDSIAALEQSQSGKQFNLNLGRVRDEFERVVHGKALTPAERSALKGGAQAQYQPDEQQQVPPQGQQQGNEPRRTSTGATWRVVQ